MKKNVGNIDRNIRYVAAALFFVLGIYFNVWWLYIIAGILAITAFIGFCGPYKLFNIDTTKKK